MALIKERLIEGLKMVIIPGYCHIWANYVTGEIDVEDPPMCWQEDRVAHKR